jgi:hypothetical protein
MVCWYGFRWPTTEGTWGDWPTPADSMEMQGFPMDRNECAKDIVLAVETAGYSRGHLGR